MGSRVGASKLKKKTEQKQFEAAQPKAAPGKNLAVIIIVWFFLLARTKKPKRAPLCCVCIGKKSIEACLQLSNPLSRCH